jgi:hypothetical protein
MSRQHERAVQAATVDLALEDIEAGPACSPSAMGEVVDEAHPVLAGRVLVRVERERDCSERWVPCLFGVRPRVGDRVLLVNPSGSPEPIVVGVVDGYRRRLEPEVRGGALRTLKDDEAVRIEAADGRGLVEVRASEAGCTVTLLCDDAKLAAAGTLTIEAEALTLRARQGMVSVKASDDVAIEGEHIRLN